MQNTPHVTQRLPLDGRQNAVFGADHDTEVSTLHGIAAIVRSAKHREQPDIKPGQRERKHTKNAVRVNSDDGGNDGHAWMPCTIPILHMRVQCAMVFQYPLGRIRARPIQLACDDLCKKQPPTLPPSYAINMRVSHSGPTEEWILLFANNEPAPLPIIIANMLSETIHWQKQNMHTLKRWRVGCVVGVA